MIRLAKEKDIDRINEIYSKIHDEEENGVGVTGWDREVYPTKETALNAINKGEMYVEVDEGIIVASAIFNQEQVPEYKDCDWLYRALDDEIMVIHTLVVDPDLKGKGYGKDFVKFYEEYALSKDCGYLRMDTGVNNKIARTFYKNMGFRESGVVYCEFNGISDTGLVCLEKKL